MKTKKYFGEKPLEGPIAFGDMYKNPSKSVSISETKHRDSRSNHYPSPEQLAEYERISKGSSSHIIAMLDKEQINRHAFSQRSLKAKIFSYRLSMLLCFLVVLFIASSSIYLAIGGYEVQSIILSIATVVAIAGVYKHNKSQAIRDNKNYNKNRNFRNKK
jgi:uncharacterized membrane protein